MILDDYMLDMSDDLALHLVLTDESVGLTDSDIKMAENILKETYYPKITTERLIRNEDTIGE